LEQNIDMSSFVCFVLIQKVVYLVHEDRIWVLFVLHRPRSAFEAFTFPQSAVDKEKKDEKKRKEKKSTHENVPQPSRAAP
jgi:hypothetical protein